MKKVSRPCIPVLPILHFAIVILHFSMFPPRLSLSRSFPYLLFHGSEDHRRRRAALALRDEVAQRRGAAGPAGTAVHLTAILVGSTPAGELYAERQRQACQAVGINYELRTFATDIAANALAQEIQKLNHDPAVSGIMLHLPLPKHLDATAMQYQIDPVKDVEGVNPANIGYVVYGHTLIAPCTALAVIELIKSTGVACAERRRLSWVPARSLANPIALLLTEQMATVTLCHIATRDLQQHTRRAEILVVAVGKPGLIGADAVRDGAIVIDVGINRVLQPDGTKKTVGDVDFEPVRTRRLDHPRPRRRRPDDRLDAPEKHAPQRGTRPARSRIGVGGSDITWLGAVRKELFKATASKLYSHHASDDPRDVHFGQDGARRGTSAGSIAPGVGGS